MYVYMNMSSLIIGTCEVRLWFVYSRDLPVYKIRIYNAYNTVYRIRICNTVYTIRCSQVLFLCFYSVLSCHFYFVVME